MALMASVPIDGDLVEGAVGAARLVLEHALPVGGGKPHVFLFFLPIAPQLGALGSEGVPEPNDLLGANPFGRGERRIIRAPDPQRVGRQRAGDRLLLFHRPETFPLAGEPHRFGTDGGQPGGKLPNLVTPEAAHLLAQAEHAGQAERCRHHPANAASAAAPSSSVLLSFRPWRKNACTTSILATASSMRALLPAV